MQLLKNSQNLSYFSMKNQQNEYSSGRFFFFTEKKGKWDPMLL